MEFPKLYTLQDQVQLDYLLKQLRWEKTVANNFLIALDSMQLCSGFTAPILELVATTLDLSHRPNSAVQTQYDFTSEY